MPATLVFVSITSDFALKRRKSPLEDVKRISDCIDFYDWESKAYLANQHLMHSSIDNGGSGL